jgi:hypothetical protein
LGARRDPEDGAADAVGGLGLNRLRESSGELLNELEYGRGRRYLSRHVPVPLPP